MKTQLTPRGGNVGAAAPQLEALSTPTRVEIEPKKVGTTETRDISAGEKKNIGQIASKELAPQRTIVGTYHKGEKTSSPAMQQLNKGFEADKAGNYASAQRSYETGFGLLRLQVVGELGDELKAKGYDPDWLLTNNNPAVFASMLREGHFDASPGVKDAFKIYLNRSALAAKHEGSDIKAEHTPEKQARSYHHAMLLASMALDIDPNYGPANYNMACTALKYVEAGLPNADRIAGGALEYLGKAIADKSFDFKKLAREGDTDWNGMRMNAEFRALVGLPPLPTAT